MNVIVKLPSRERPARLQDAVLAMLNKATFRPNFLFAVDTDDLTVPHYWLNTIGAVAIGPRASKIEACNRGVSLAEWDIVVLASDDMLCQVQGWDDIIRQDMATHFPDTDGCLWYPDGHQENLCTLAVMGRKAFDRDGYIYRPEYKSLWADTEWTEVWSERGRLWKSDRQLFKHMHPGWGAAKIDDLYKVNNNFDREDRVTYLRRKTYNFPA